MISTILTVFFALLFSLCSNTAQGAQPAQKTIHKAIQASQPYTKIECDNAIKLIIEPRTTGNIVVSYPEQVENFFRATVKENKLYLDIVSDRSLNSLKGYKAVVRIPHNPALREIELGAACNLSNPEKLTFFKLDIEAQAASRVELNADIHELEVEASSASAVTINGNFHDVDLCASSAARITLSGSAHKCEIESSSASSIATADLECDRVECEASSGAKCTASAKDARVEASSGAKIDITCSNSLRYTSSSGGKVNYSGTANVIKE